MFTSIGARNRHESMNRVLPHGFSTVRVLAEGADLGYNAVSFNVLSPLAVMASNRHNLVLDEQSFQSLLSAAFTIQGYNDRKIAGPAKTISVTPRTGSSQRAGLPAVQLTAGLAELLNCVPNQLLREIAQQALQATHAMGAAIALEQQGELICRATAGDSASEIGAMINAGSGFAGVCASSGRMQLCGNTALDSRVDAGACRQLGISAITVVPLLHQDRVLGLIAVFSRRPYAFGVRDLQALQDLAEKFSANLQFSAGPANASTGRESPGVAASSPLGGERSRKG